MPRIHVPSSDLAVPAEELQPTAEPAESAGESAGDDEGAVVGLDTDGPAKRKRSRRGSRGGKKRRKPAAAGGDDASSAEGGPEAEMAVEATPSDEVPAYVPMSEWIDDFETRSRG